MALAFLTHVSCALAALRGRFCGKAVALARPSVEAVMKG